MTATTCPKCGSRFEEGFALDRGDHHIRHQSLWIAGKPERSFLVGLKIRGKAKHPIATWRCTRCGFLESYALSAPEAR